MGHFQVAAVGQSDEGISEKYGEDVGKIVDKGGHRENDEERSDGHGEDRSQEIISSASYVTSILIGIVVNNSGRLSRPVSIDTKGIDTKENDNEHPQPQDDDTKYFRRIHIICMGVASLWSSQGA